MQTVSSHADCEHKIYDFAWNACKSRIDFTFHSFTSIQQTASLACVEVVTFFSSCGYLRCTNKPSAGHALEQQLQLHLNNTHEYVCSARMYASATINDHYLSANLLKCGFITASMVWCGQIVLVFVVYEILPLPPPLIFVYRRRRFRRRHLHRGHHRLLLPLSIVAVHFSTGFSDTYQWQMIAFSDFLLCFPYIE